MPIFCLIQLRSIKALEDYDRQQLEIIRRQQVNEAAMARPESDQNSVSQSDSSSAQNQSQI